MMREIMKLDSTQNYILSGKTGLATRNDKYIGWFVGFIEKKDNVYFFATKITPSNNPTFEEFVAIRKSITINALKKLKIID
ncbi:hypothetical protein KRX57_08635 [Weeksellaceae bacterium TAE3-ERU29]|nr:hypothetical protein [Weeksellaceae bacterium TAE3-ERU29]